MLGPGLEWTRRDLGSGPQRPEIVCHTSDMEAELNGDPEPTVEREGRTIDLRSSRAWLLIAGGLLIIGSLLPWAQTGTFSFSGVSGDGVLTLVMGAIVAGLAYPSPSRSTAWFVLGMATVSVLIAFDVYTSLARENIGIGVLVVSIGGLVALVAAAMTWSHAPNPRPRRGNRP